MVGEIFEYSSNMAKDLLMLGLCETMDQLAMASRVCWYGHVLMREDGRVLRRALHFEVDMEKAG